MYTDQYDPQLLQRDGRARLAASAAPAQGNFASIVLGGLFARAVS
jgi:hypothetical protein